MFTARTRKGLAGVAIGAAAALALAGCASSSPLESGEQAGDGSAEAPIVVGSQAYPSNEIIAEIYAQALEAAGFEVKKQLNIGQRPAYIPLLESGEVNVFPEYSGNLLQYFDKETEARTAEDVYDALPDALPSGLKVLEQSTATDQDSYTVTAAFAKENKLTTIADLAEVTVPLTLGGPIELAERPYGPTGLKSVYGVDVTFSPTGETTVDDLLAGTVNVANVFTASPRIETDDLVVLEDPEGLFLASNVIPVVSEDFSDEAAEVINKVSKALTPEGLVSLNVENTEGQRSAEDVAADWLKENDLA